MDSNASGIDLHIHSTASDGTLSPNEILRLALKSHLAAIAITDHDTLKGSREICGAVTTTPLRLLTGIEVSVTAPFSSGISGSLHILGYGIRLDDPTLNASLETLQSARKNRNPHIIDRLNALGIDVSIEEVSRISGGAQIGRPHIARLMLQKGLVKSINEAFDLYLGFQKPAYVEKYRLACDQAIQIISKAGGLAVLAHPILLKIPDNDRLESLIVALKEMGLQGIEAYYPEHSPEYTAYCSSLAQKHDLIITGGTDFHGAVKPGIQMGSGKGDFKVPYTVYERLVERHHEVC